MGRLSTSSSPMRPSTGNSGASFFLGAGGDGPEPYGDGQGRRREENDDGFFESSEMDQPRSRPGSANRYAPRPRNHNGDGEGDRYGDFDSGDVENRVPGSVGTKVGPRDHVGLGPGSAPRGGSGGSGGGRRPLSASTLTSLGAPRRLDPHFGPGAGARRPSLLGLDPKAADRGRALRAASPNPLKER